MTPMTLVHMVAKDFPLRQLYSHNSVPFTLRGTSRSPPEAWDTRSEPDTRSTKGSEDDWANVTNTSYNLLDLDPFYNGDIDESASPTQPGVPFCHFVIQFIFLGFVKHYKK